MNPQRLNCELDYGRKIPTGGSDWCGSDRTLTTRSEWYWGGRTPTGGSDLANKIMGDL